MVDIIPAILTSDPDEASEMLSVCDGVVSRVQLDIIDGVFAENTTVKTSGINRSRYSLGFDFHLMVDEPINWIEDLNAIEGDRVIGQIEKMSGQTDFVNAVQAKNLGVGLGIDLNTDVSKLESEVLELLDVVLIMSVKAGFGGQEFQFKALEKIKILNELRIKNRIPFRICVDGGENEDVIDDTFWSGADQVAIGRRLFKGGIAANIKKLQKAAVK
jgi:ribulose-phosphate 3-epimerase